MTIELSEQEVGVLLQLIHIAVQARGMEVAEASVVLTKKIQASRTAPTPVPVRVEDDQQKEAA